MFVQQIDVLVAKVAKEGSAVFFHAQPIATQTDSSVSERIITKKMLDLKRHDGICLRLHLGNAVNGLELIQEPHLRTVSAAFEVTPFGSIEAGNDLEIQTTAADDALDALDTVDRFDGGEGVGKQLLSGNQRGLVSVGRPLFMLAIE